MIAKRVPPTVKDPELSRIVRDIYEVLNEMVDTIGKYEISQPRGEEGRTGEVRVSKLQDNTYQISVKSGEGWVVSSTGTFTFQERI